MSSQKCAVNMFTGPCGRAVVRDGKCIFHLENKTDEETVQFEKAFPKELERLEKSAKHVIDLTRFTFHRPLRFRRRIFSKIVRLHRATFKGSRSLRSRVRGKSYARKREIRRSSRLLLRRFKSDVTFSFAVFRKKADYSRATFEGGASFQEATFKKLARFRASFDEEVIFRGAKFEKEADFFDTRFRGAADFSNATFKGETSFFKATFEGEARFAQTIFDGEAEFVRTTFRKPASFFSAKFGKAAGFYRATFEAEAEFYVTRFDAIVRFRSVSFLKPESVVFDLCDLSNVSFLDTETVAQVSFRAVTWNIMENRCKLVDECYIGMELGGPTYANVADVYRRLRRNYESKLRYAEAGQFFKSEMEMKRMAIAPDLPKYSKPRRVLNWLKRNFSVISFYKLLSVYGESWKRVGLWIAISIPFFALLRALAVLVRGEICMAQMGKILSESLSSSFFAFFQARTIDVFDIIERVWSGLLLGLAYIALRRQLERHRLT